MEKSKNKIEFLIIGLKRPSHLINFIENINYKATWIEGIWGEKLTPSEIKLNTNKNVYFIPPAVVGIALSHFKAWKYFLSSPGSEYCIVLEDDAIFEKDFDVKIKQIIENLNMINFDIFYLGCFGCDTKTNIFSGSTPNSNSGKFEIISDQLLIPSVAYGTHAYIISRKGALKLLAKMEFNIKNHIDMEFNYFHKKNYIKRYAFTPRIVFQTSTDSLYAGERGGNVPSGERGGNLYIGKKSNNTKSTHPYILDFFTSRISLDKNFKLNYITNVSLYNVFGINITNMAFLFFIIGVCLKKSNISARNASILFCLITFPDFFIEINMSIFINYIFLIFPYLLPI